MTDATNHDDVRELEDAGLAGYASGPEAVPPPGGATAAAAGPDPLRPYSAEELAQLTAGLSAFGLPADRLSAYQAKVLASTRPAFEVLGIGEALAEYGVGHGGGIDAMPAWVRLLAGAGVVGYIVVSTRAEFRDKPEPDEDAEGAAA